MKNEIPPSTTIAPMAMMIAELPLKALPLPAVVVVLTVGAAVVVVGVDTVCWGNPGNNGLVAPDCAVAAAGHASVDQASAAPTRTRSRIDLTPRAPSDYASGCSIAGVSGAST